MFVFSRLYNPADYEHLAVSPEVKELFQYISRSVLAVLDLHVCSSTTARVADSSIASL